MTFQTWAVYALAVLVLTVTPGPAVFMCITQSVHHGARRAMACALGSITAVLGIMACSALGLGALLAASSGLFNAVKWAGAAYLLYLGVSTLRAKTSDFAVPTAPQSQAPGQTSAVDQGVSTLSLYARGLLVGASNPKALLFFTAFFPQFINPSLPQGPQFAVLGATFVAFELFWLGFYAGFAARLGPWLRVPGRAKWFNRASGGTFIGAALVLASAKRG